MIIEMTCSETQNGSDVFINRLLMLLSHTCVSTQILVALKSEYVSVTYLFFLSFASER